MFYIFTWMQQWLLRFFYDSHRFFSCDSLLEIVSRDSTGWFPVNRTLVALLMLSLTCRISKDCAHTARCELTQRRVLRSAVFVRRDRRKREDTFPSALRLSAIYRSFVKTRLCTTLRIWSSFSLPPSVFSTILRTIYVVCYRVIVSTFVCDVEAVCLTERNKLLFFVLLQLLATLSVLFIT